jgi:tetratricopeptide (TPR) repeat protein
VSLPKIGHPAAFLALLAVSIGVSPGPVEAQGLSEYGAVLAAPKGLPSSAANTLTNPYRSLNLSPGSSSGSSSSSHAAVNSKAATSSSTSKSGADDATFIDGNGEKQIDPKKAQEIGAKAQTDYQKAKSKLHSSNPEDWKVAEALIRSAITSRNSIWGYSDPVIPKMLEDLGALYTKEDHADTAISCYKSALIYITKQKGSGSYERLDVMLKLGKLLRNKGEHREALNYLKQAALINERQYGREFSKSLETKLDWAMEADQVGVAEADTVYRDCVDTMEHLDPNSANVQACPLAYDSLRSALNRHYSDYLKRQGRLEEAAELSTRLKIVEEKEAPDESKATIGEAKTENKTEAKNSSETKAETLTH